MIQKWRMQRATVIVINLHLYPSLPLSLIFRITQMEEYIAHLYQMSQNWVIDLFNKVIN